MARHRLEHPARPPAARRPPRGGTLGGRGPAPPRRPPRAAWAVAGLLLMIVLATTGTAISIAALVGAAVVTMAGCLTAEELYQAVDWRSIVFIGAMRPISTALT